MAERIIKHISSNPDQCLGCKSCELACAKGKASKYTVSDMAKKRTAVPNIIVTQNDDKRYPAYCRQCEDAFCMNMCPAKAIERVDGVIMVNEKKCTGCGICEQACPYGVITMSTYENDSKVKKIANKCNLCMERQLNDEDPLCYLACPTKAIRLI